METQNVENKKALVFLDEKQIKTTFGEVQKNIANQVANILAVKIETQEDFKKLEEMAKDAKKFEKQVEERRKEIVAPHNDYVKRVKAFTDAVISPIEGAIAHSKREFLAWNKKLEQQRIEAQRKLDEERRRKEEEARDKLEKEKEEAEMASAFMPENEQAAIAVSHQVQEQVLEKQIALESKAEQKAINQMKVKGVRKVWKFEVQVPTEVPREYLMVNEVMIRSAVSNGIREIPGVRIYEDEVMAIR